MAQLVPGLRRSCPTYPRRFLSSPTKSASVSSTPWPSSWWPREQALESSNLIVQTIWAGDYARVLPLLESEAEAALTRGQLARAARGMFIAAYCDAALGRFEAARATLEQAQHLVDRLGVPVFALFESKAGLALALGEPDEELAGTLERMSAAPHPGAAWGLGWIYGSCAAFAPGEEELEKLWPLRRRSRVTPQPSGNGDRVGYPG